MEHVLGWGWGRCVQMSLKVPTPSSNGHKTTTRPLGGGGVPGATSLKREAEVVLQVCERWFLKFDLPLRTLGTPHVTACTMGTVMSTQSPPPPHVLCPLRPCPWTPQL